MRLFVCRCTRLVGHYSAFINQQQNLKIGEAKIIVSPDLKKNFHRPCGLKSHGIFEIMLRMEKTKSFTEYKKR